MAIWQLIETGRRSELLTTAIGFLHIFLDANANDCRAHFFNQIGKACLLRRSDTDCFGAGIVHHAHWAGCDERTGQRG
ncbi:hypothetical protein FQZ97_1248790 [compost metagenome]